MPRWPKYEGTIPEGMKWCPQGRHLAAVNEFGKAKSNPDGLCNSCKECVRTRKRKLHDWTERASASAPKGQKWCSDHKGYKDFPDFHRGQSICKDCSKIRESKRDQYLRYGIDRREFENIRSSQNNQCASCEDELVRPHLDHCHDTGKIRGILCHHCNVALGFLRDDPRRVRSLLRYIEES